MPHKRIDVAIRAFNELAAPAGRVGNGPDARRLRRLAGPTITFTGRVGDAEAAALLSARPRARRDRHRGVRDRGGRGAGRRPARSSRWPTAASARPSSTAETGTFYATPDPAALAEAVVRFDALAVDPGACVDNAARFDAAHFRHGLRAVVDRTLAARRGESPPPRRSPRRPAGLVWQT